MESCPGREDVHHWLVLRARTPWTTRLFFDCSRHSLAIVRGPCTTMWRPVRSGSSKAYPFAWSCRSLPVWRCHSLLKGDCWVWGRGACNYFYANVTARSWFIKSSIWFQPQSCVCPLPSEVSRSDWLSRWHSVPDGGICCPACTPLPHSPV